jgi:hypothetical protein
LFIAADYEVGFGILLVDLGAAFMGKDHLVPTKFHHVELNLLEVPDLSRCISIGIAANFIEILMFPLRVPFLKGR